MPELPEVETVVRTIARRAAGRRIAAFRSTWKKNVRPGFAAVGRGLVGRRVDRVWRRAKYVVFDLDDESRLLVHLRMSGRLVWSDDDRGTARHVRHRWRFEDGLELWFDDARKFGTVDWTRDLDAHCAALGVEPLERGFTTRRLAALVSGRARRLKPLLLDQTVIAGLGNIYADEALFAAGLHPLRSAASLTMDEVGRLHRAIRRVLREGIRRNGTSIDWIYPGGTMQEHLAVYGRGGEPCRQCGGLLELMRVSQRATVFCALCQPMPDALRRGS